MLATQAKRIPQASQSPWVRSHATEKTTPESMAMKMAVRVGSRAAGGAGEAEE